MQLLPPPHPSHLAPPLLPIPGNDNLNNLVFNKILIERKLRYSKKKMVSVNFNVQKPIPPSKECLFTEMKKMLQHETFLDSFQISIIFLFIPLKNTCSIKYFNFFFAISVYFVETSTSIPPSSVQTSAPNTSSAFSRTSPNVQFSHPSSHRSSSPSQPPSSLTRGSPLHLSHHSSSRDDRQAMRQQTSHITPPPTSSSSLISSPMNKMYGPQTPTSQPSVQPSQQSTPQSRSITPPHHLRAGTSPVLRHPQPVPLPLIGQPSPIPSPMMGIHPHNPYAHHLLHPMFYSQHNPFNSPYPYHPYGPAGFQYIKPPPGPGLEQAVLSHHAGQATRCEDPSPHVEKQNSSSQNLSHKVKFFRINILYSLKYNK